MAPRLQSGLVVRDRFHLERMLGAGGHSSVWLAKDRAIEGEEVAVKFLDPALCSRPRVLERFEREGRLLAELAHDSIARIVSYSADAQQPFIAMEYVKGQTLSSFVARASAGGSPIPLDTVATIFEGISAAVAHAHRSGVIHRDLKPSNVMLESNPRGLHVKVLDFGIAKVLDVEASERTTIGRALGTPLYAAPEQQAGIRVDERADVFGLGAILFELLTSRRAFGRNEHGEPLESHRELSVGPNKAPEVASRMMEPRPSALRFRADLPDALERLVARSLSLQPADRPPSVEALIGAFREAFGGQTLDASMLEALRALPRPVVSTPQQSSSVRTTPRVVETPAVQPARGLPPRTVPLLIAVTLLSAVVATYFLSR